VLGLVVSSDLTPKEIYKRLKYQEAMQKKVAAAENKITVAEKALEAIIKTCHHYHCTYVNKGSTGSWDRDDYYWREYECADCGDRWTTSQSREDEKKFPYAVNKTYK
jgi:hypothetical protein